MFQFSLAAVARHGGLAATSLVARPLPSRLAWLASPTCTAGGRPAVFLRRRGPMGSAAVRGLLTVPDLPGKASDQKVRGLASFFNFVFPPHRRVHPGTRHLPAMRNRL